MQRSVLSDVANRNVDNREKYFRDVFDDLPTPRIYDDVISWGANDAEKLFEYMGGPIVGFLDKWPNHMGAFEKAKNDPNQEELWQ